MVKFIRALGTTASVDSARPLAFESRRMVTVSLTLIQFPCTVTDQTLSHTYMSFALEAGALMVNAPLERSWPMLPAPSWATTLTKALVLGVLGTVQLYDPELDTPVAIAVNVPPAPVVE